MTSRAPWMSCMYGSGSPVQQSLWSPGACIETQTIRAFITSTTVARIWNDRMPFQYMHRNYRFNEGALTHQRVYQWPALLETAHRTRGDAGSLFTVSWVRIQSQTQSWMS